MLRVALTGGIATGKSACLRRFSSLGAATLDTDVVARTVVGPGTPGLAAVVRRFGAGLLRSDGTLDREALGRIVFADATARRDLEALVHPAVYQAVQDWFRQLAAGAVGPASPTRRIGIVDIPLLYETGREGDFDAVVVAASRPDQQVARLMARDGLDEAAARQRLAAQWPIEKKAERADFVIDTSGTMDETLAGADEVWKRLQAGPSCGRRHARTSS